MAKFIRVADGCYINVDQITSIIFDPSSFGLVLSIHTSDSKINWSYADTLQDRKCMRYIVDDLRDCFELTDQLPSFWDLTSDLDRWLQEKEVHDVQS